MNFRPTPDEEPEINLIPLIDVLLLTLIFLIVTTSFSNEAQLQVKLPEAAATTAPPPAALRVTIDARGQYYINNQQLLSGTPDVLRSAMLREAGGNKDKPIIVQADAKTPHEAVVRLMDVARRIGMTHLTFAAQQPAPGPDQ